MVVDREILNVIGYRRFNQKKDLLAAILEYVNERLHPTMIKQLNMLISQIGQKTCDFLINVRQDYFDSDMRNNICEQWLIWIYLTKLKDKKLLNEY